MGRSSETALTRLSIHVPPEQLPLGFPVLSPDGQSLVYSGGDQLYLRRLDEHESAPISGTEGARLPFFSPDGKWVGFGNRRTSEGLKKVFLGGGTPDSLAPALFFAGASWGEDGNIVFGGNVSPLMRVSSEGGGAEGLTTLNREAGERSHRMPQILPDGKTVLFTVAGDEGVSVALASLQTGEHRTLFTGSSARYVPTGHVFFYRAGDLLVDRFDLSHLEASGAPIPILHDVSARQSGGVSVARYALSDSGRLVYRRGGVMLQPRQLVWVERDGQSTPFSESEVTESFSYPRLAPDGRRLSVSVENEVGRNIWLYELDRRTRTRVTFEGNQATSAWAPDSRRLAFSFAPRGIYWKDIRDAAPETLLTDKCVDVGEPTPNCGPSSWSSDGKFLLISGESGIRVHAVDGGDAPQPFPPSRFTEGAAVFSPDGRFIALVSDESGREEVYIQPFRSPGVKQSVSSEGGTEPLWSPNGRELFYRQGNAMMAVAIEWEPEFRLRATSRLFEGPDEPSSATIRNYDVSPDGERFIMLQRVDVGVPYFDVVLNWRELLDRQIRDAN